MHEDERGLGEGGVRRMDYLGELVGVKVDTESGTGRLVFGKL